MSRFYATVQGNRQPKGCGGSAKSGINATAQSYEGSVQVRLYVDDNDVTCCTIHIDEGSTPDPGYHRIYDGTLADLFTRKAIKAIHESV